MTTFCLKSASLALLLLIAAGGCLGQRWERKFSAAKGDTIEIINRYGRVDVNAVSSTLDERSALQGDGSATASASGSVSESNIRFEFARGRVRIEVLGAAGKRVDLSLSIPERVRIKVETSDGEVRISGNFELAEAVTETGTIAADVPTEEVKYDLLWTTSRPRFLSDFELANVKERSGGKFALKGTYKSREAEAGLSKDETSPEPAPETERQPGNRSGKKGAARDRLRSKQVSLRFTTARGIILLNVPPDEVSSDLRERPLTEAAKAIVRSGDVILMDAIRRASPKYFGEYSRTLPPVRRAPELSLPAEREITGQAIIKRATVRVTDQFNRAIAGLKSNDFVVTENGVEREIISIEPATAPFNLVLLLDVSGSVEKSVTFIRKAARSFVNTVDSRDRVSLVLFNDDVKLLARFTTDKGKLSESLDTFDAGGGTAYYDALAYTLADTLRPLKGERTAIVVLTDGDDNRSFLSFEGLIGAVEESGALIYPLYVPSALIAASLANQSQSSIDPLRTRYIGLSTKAKGEGEKLAAVSGGIYFPITQLSQIQTAYDDIVVQLRTAYVVTFRSELSEIIGERRISPRTRVKVHRANAFAALGPITRVEGQHRER